MSIFHELSDTVSAAVGTLAEQAVVPSGIDLSRIVVEPTRDPSHGDVSTNAALVLSKDAGLKPRELADRLIQVLESSPVVEKIAVAGPGFINLTLKPEVWQKALREAAFNIVDFAHLDLGQGQRLNIEYVSANPTGPMHVGHCRGAVFGDALASLLKVAGYDVTREYYINDAGAQVDVLARSAYLRYREALGEDIGDIPEGLYPGDYLRPVGKALAEKYGRSFLDLSEKAWIEPIRSLCMEMMLAQIREDLKALHIYHDVFFSEKSLVAGGEDHVGAVIESLRAAGHIYQGRLPPPKGAAAEDWEDREQTLFRATAFGDDVDRPLMKSDDSYTYFAADIAYHASKIARGFSRMINVWGADHGGYIKRMQAAVRAVSDGTADLRVEIIQLVRLLRDGEPVKMSKRAGEFVTLRDVVNEVGRDAVRFMMLYRKNDASLDFDLSKVMIQSRENPVFYVQYAHARCKSVLRHADFSVEGLESVSLDVLTDEGELRIMKQIAQYPRLLEQSALHLEPHRLAFYLYDLASDLHAQWNCGKDTPDLRFIMENNSIMTQARLVMVQAVANVIAHGLAVLGVQAPEEMR